MKQYLRLATTGVIVGAAMILGFQNCSKGSLPDTSEVSSQSAPVELTDVEIKIEQPLVAVNATQIITATGGTGVYEFSLDGSSCRIDRVTGAFTAAASEGKACLIRVTDGNTTATGTVTTQITTPAEPEVDPKSFPLDSDQTFAVPAFNTLTIEVYGGGGGGGGLTYIASNSGSAGPGASGGTSSVKATGVNLSATGGAGGTAGEVRSHNGVGGAGGAGTNAGNNGTVPNGGKGANPAGGAGGGTVIQNFSGYASLNAQPGVIPGGGGGATGFTSGEASNSSGGGGGGGYSKVTFAKGTIRPGLLLKVVVGKGGKGGIFTRTNGEKVPQGGDGARGVVILTVK